MRVSFKSVTAIVAKPKLMERLEQDIQQKNPKNPYFLMDLTHLYKNRPVMGRVGAAVNNKKQQADFLVVGDEHKKLSFMDHGWGSETAPTRHIDELLNVTDKNYGKILQKLLTRIEKDDLAKPKPNEQTSGAQ